MQGRGFEDTQSVYLSDDPHNLVGQFRRFGEVGPAYEILRIQSKGTACIRVMDMKARMSTLEQHEGQVLTRQGQVVTLLGTLNQRLDRFDEIGPYRAPSRRGWGMRMQVGLGRRS